MDVAVFRLSQRDRRAGELIHYELPDGHVTVSGGAAGWFQSEPRLDRRVARKAEVMWSFQTIYDQNGSSGILKKFTENLRKIINSNFPEYKIE
ncbi:hypothetical protein [Gluconobacter wancherniae]|nr:hypothetical protein [Gluconobacter wancherniae]MBS1095871.1 hypothetical protein [Gluconobacter wancherniae]